MGDVINDNDVRSWQFSVGPHGSMIGLGDEQTPTVWDANGNEIQIDDTQGIGGGLALGIRWQQSSAKDILNWGFQLRGFAEGVFGNHVDYYLTGAEAVRSSSFHNIGFGAGPLLGVGHPRFKLIWEPQFIQRWFVKAYSPRAYTQDGQLYPMSGVAELSSAWMIAPVSFSLAVLGEEKVKTTDAGEKKFVANGVSLSVQYARAPIAASDVLTGIEETIGGREGVDPYFLGVSLLYTRAFAIKHTQEGYRDRDRDEHGALESDPVYRWGDFRPGFSNLDDDCDDRNAGLITDCEEHVYHKDADGDGYGSRASSDGESYKADEIAKGKPEADGYVDNDDDCDDSDPALATDCSDHVYYKDADRDGLGSPASGTKTYKANEIAAKKPESEGYVAKDGDCDDSRNDLTTDCSEGTSYPDTDGDAYGDRSSPLPYFTAIGVIGGHVTDGADCDDTNGAIHPGAVDTCGDGIDQDCDGSDPSCEKTWYRDSDKDGYGDSGTTEFVITQPRGYVEDGSDCDDGNGAINPGAEEVCDGIDNNCDGVTDELGGTSVCTRVVITRSEIKLNEKVHFEHAKAKILPDSFPLLDEVASVLKSHPEITGVEVGGHTDSTGSETYNQDLSQRRAAAVMTYLVKKGIDQSRLTAKGFGESLPLENDDGKKDSEEAAKNRRVEILITDRSGE